MILGCCCDPAPPANELRRIWTERPFGKFWRQWDVEYWENSQTEVLNSLSEVVGYTGWSNVEHQTLPYPRPVTPVDADILWLGVRYKCRREYTYLHYYNPDDPSRHFELERNDYELVDIDSGATLNDGFGDTINYSTEPIVAATNGELLSWVEECSETFFRRTIEYEHALHVFEYELLETVTYAEQVERARAHLDATVGSITLSQLRGSMTIVGDGDDLTWVYPSKVLFDTTKAHTIKLTPPSGALTATAEGYTYVPWELGSPFDHIVSDTDTAAGLADFLFGICVATIPSGEGPVSEVFETPSINYGPVPKGFIGLDDSKAMACFVCLSVKDPYGCDEPFAWQSMLWEFDQEGTNQPAWITGTGATDGCVDPTDFADPGYYYFNETGVALATTEIYNFANPLNPYFSRAYFQSTCCPP